MADDSPKNKRVLIVEDEAIIAMDSRDTLEDFTFKIVGIAGSGEKSIDLAEKHKPDLILMDIWLKGKMDGITAASIIREKIDIPIVFVSAHLDLKTFESAKLPDGCLSIKKPILDVELIAACRNVLLL